MCKLLGGVVLLICLVTGAQATPLDVLGMQTRLEKNCAENDIGISYIKLKLVRYREAEARGEFKKSGPDEIFRYLDGSTFTASSLDQPKCALALADNSLEIAKYLRLEFPGEQSYYAAADSLLAEAQAHWVRWMFGDVSLRSEEWEKATQSIQEYLHHYESPEGPDNTALQYMFASSKCLRLAQGVPQDPETMALLDQAIYYGREGLLYATNPAEVLYALHMAFSTKRARLKREHQDVRPMVHEARSLLEPVVHGQGPVAVFLADLQFSEFDQTAGIATLNELAQDAEARRYFCEAVMVGDGVDAESFHGIATFMLVNRERGSLYVKEICGRQ